MKRKPVFFAALSVFGACLSIAALVLQRFSIPDNLGGTLMGTGSGLCAFSLVQVLALRGERKNPEEARRSEIARNDERNAAIRSRAKALSGDILQWGILAGAWASIGLSAPLWVTLLLITAFVAKSLAELFLILRYQNVM